MKVSMITSNQIYTVSILHKHVDLHDNSKTMPDMRYMTQAKAEHYYNS